MSERALAALVREQRWFGSKSRSLAGGRIVDSGALSADCVLALFETDFVAGGSELYQLPYRLAGDGALVLDLADPALAAALVGALRSSAPLAMGAGEVAFELAVELPGDAELQPVRAIGGEQSNSSVVFGERCALKAYRRLEAGEGAELEMLRFLDAHGFEHTPRLLGSYRYAGAPLAVTLGILQEFVPDARDGWQDALASLADPAAFLSRLGRLGEVTARMHVLLASDDRDDAFRPEALGERSDDERRALLAGLPEPVHGRSGELLEHLRALGRAGAGGKAIRQHGDFHLGQVLWARGDWVVIDFEGEPARPLAERRAKSTPLRDVAGMLRSFAYAAETGRSLGAPGPPGWERDARGAFLDAYEAVIDQSLLPPAGPARDALLAACELEKALYELRYELDNRPDWAHVPLAGIERLLGGAHRGV
ncbi:MAG: phosphotransferase [Actinomycetota bacterium]|nr:phosphotransferase [Actinomycetota bacterium]